MTPGARLAAIVGALGLVLGLAGTAALFVGSAAVTPASVLAVLAGSERAEAVAVVVVLDLRLPRIIVAALAGGALAVAGVGFQALTRNPLAEPSVLGVASGAAFGVVTGQLFGLGLSVLEAIGLTAFAFAGAFVAGGAVYLIASTAAGLPVHTLLLAGVIVGIFFSSAGMDYFFDGKLASLLQGGWRRIWLALDFFGRTGVLLAGAGLCAALGVAVGPSPGSLPRHRSTARLAILTLLIGSLAYFKQGGFGHPHYLNGIWPAHLLALVVLLEIPKLKPVTLPLLWLQALCLLGFILLTQQGIHERGGTRGIHYGVSLRQQIEIVRQTAGAESAETDIEQFRSFGHSLSTIQMLGMAGQREKVQGRFFVGFRETGDPSDAHVEIRRIDSR